MSERTDIGHGETRQDSYDGTLRPNPGKKGRRTAALVVALGLWIVAEEYLLDTIAGAVWGGLGVGLLLVLLGGYNFYRRTNGWSGSAAVGALVVLIGLGLAVRPLLLGSTVWTVVTESPVTVLRGVAAIALGSYSVHQSRTLESEGGVAPT